MTTYGVQSPTHAGSAIALSAPGGTAGDLAPTGPGVALAVATSSNACTVTLPITSTYDTLSINSRTVVIPTSTPLQMIPLPDSVYGVGTTAVNYSSVSGVTVAVIRIP